VIKPVLVVLCQPEDNHPTERRLADTSCRGSRWFGPAHVETAPTVCRLPLPTYRWEASGVPSANQMNVCTDLYGQPTLS